MPRCALCALQHRTADHECTTVGCKAPKGSVSIYLVAKCPNCKGPHGARSASCPKKKEAIEKGRNWKGKESMIQKPAPTRTPENQKVPEPEPTPKDADVMERDDGLYASRYAVQDGGCPNAKRAVMEAGLDGVRSGQFDVSSIFGPPSSLPAPALTFRYAFNRETDLEIHPGSQDPGCQVCLGTARNGASQCRGCGRTPMAFQCRHNPMQCHTDWEHLPDACGRDYVCPNDPAMKAPLPVSRAPTPSPVCISDSDTIMSSDFPRLDDAEELYWRSSCKPTWERTQMLYTASWKQQWKGRLTWLSSRSRL